MTRSWTCLLLAGALLLGACGSGDDDSSSSASGSASASGEGVDEGAFPVSIEHKYGSTTVEQAPERIVTVGLVEQDVLLALGIVPVGTTEWFGDHPGAIFPWAEDELEDLGAEPPEVVGEAADGATNFEAVARQRPDLILALHSDISEEDYERLSEIAPTVAQPEGYVDFGTPWEELTRTVGQAVGRPDEADALVEDVEAQFAAARQGHPDLAGASSVMATPYEGIFVYGPEDARGRFLTALGLELPPDLAEVTGDEFGANLSQERADMLDVDVIIWLDPEDGDGPLGGPLYETFPVHTEGREVFLDSFEDPLGAATSFVTPLSLPYLLDGLVPMLEAAVDGDPATEVPTTTPR
jgi:iron complex transport system substrate-binding protein